MSPELRDLLPLYALDALTPEEKLRIDGHLKDCAECQAELRELREVSADLALLAPPVEPPDGLKQRLMARIEEAPRKRGVIFERGGILLSRSEELPWRQILPDVEAKLLFVDRERRYNTSLIRIAPGGKYPRHQHKEVEEIYVLSGDLHIEGAMAGAGDYCRSEADSIHEESYTQNGCLFLVVASQRDEILA